MSETKNFSVLVVDDESILREIYRTYLTRAGYANIVEAYDGKMALELCQEKKFDLITLDHTMPNMNGLDFLKAIRNGEHVNRTTPVIMISGFLEDFINEVMALENVKVAEKPISHEVFMNLVTSSL